MPTPIMAPPADLPVVEVVWASHLITGLTLGAPEVVHDCLDRSRDHGRGLLSGYERTG
ncbi:hypothetical protein [Streptomyces griseoluteus]|uniref:hypothetical protein n=1 Tax=Streptomyces griseoluteus TaxID=29306 RepID=UPI00340A66B0